MKKFLLIILIAVFAACTSKVMTPRAIPTQADADRGARVFPGYTLGQLNEGKVLFESNCGKCHALKNPASRDEKSWRKIVPKMAKRAKVGAATEDLILKYVITMGKPGKGGKSAS